MTSQKGFSLFELLTSVLILGILASVAVPPLTNLRNNTTANQKTHSLLAALNFTRHNAVTVKVSTILCPSSNERNCESDWQKPWIIFEDNNRNNIHDRDERILRRYDLMTDNETLVWRGFGSQSYISFDEFGTTGHQNGRFYYCSKNEKAKRQLIVFRTGRTRIARGDSLRDRCE